MLNEPPWLAIETSGLTGSIALALGDGVHVRSLEQAGRRHAQTLTREIRELLSEHHVAPRELAGVGVSLGPGSFTGLRVGVMCAKTLGYALRCPVVGVETFRLIAEAVADDGVTRVHVIGDAQRGDLFLGEYSRTEIGWRREGAHQIVPAEAWLASLGPDDIVTGPGLTKVTSYPTAARSLVTPETTQPSARVLALVARRQVLAGEADDFWTLAPIYLRPSAAEEQWAKRAGERSETDHT